MFCSGTHTAASCVFLVCSLLHAASLFQDNNPEDCPVCLTVFDDTMRPRTLPCGHSFCTCCIDALKEQGQVTCPTCRLSHAVPEAGQFPVSYAIEAFVKRLRDAALANPPPKPVKVAAEPAALLASERCQEGTPGLSRPVQSLLQDQEAKVLAAIHTCREIQGQLQEYQTTLVDWGEWQQHLEDQLRALMDQSKSARMLMRQEESKVAIKREEEQQREQQLHAVLQELRTVSTRPEAYKVIDDAVHRTDEEKQRVKECRAMFPDVHTVTTIKKVSVVRYTAAVCYIIIILIIVRSDSRIGTHNPFTCQSSPAAQEHIFSDCLSYCLSYTSHLICL